MSKILALVLPMLLAAASFAADPLVISSTETGVLNAALSATPTTNAINMQPNADGSTTPGYLLHQLSLTFAVTPGSTTSFTVTCYESQDGTHFDYLNPCDNTTPAAVCAPDIRSYTIANYAAVGGVDYVGSRWVITKKYAKCSAYGTGTGTVTITGVRS